MKIFVYTIVALFIINISFAQVNYYVSPSGSDANDGSQANPWATIEYAVEHVSNPTTDQIIINISSGTYDLSNDQIDINRSFTNVTLAGEGSDNTFIQPAADTSLSNSRVIEIYAQNKVSLKNLTIRYGRFPSTTDSKDGGAGILNSGGILTIDNCTIKENSGILSDIGIGGGISNINGTLTINNSNISNNRGATGAGDSGAQGGGIGSVDGTLNVLNSTINDNYAPLTGGGICVISSSANSVFNMENSTVYGNTAKSYGGVRITVFGSYKVTSDINSCTIFNNSAYDAYGGFGLTVPSNCLIKNTIIAGNFAYNQSSTASPSNLTGSSGLIAVTSGGYNIFQTVSDVSINGATTNGIGLDPQLLPLAYNNSINGTQTCAISANSPAKDQIPPANDYNESPLLDQRGFPRYGYYEIGAYEYTPFVTVNVKVFLEGPYDGAGAMTTTLNTNNLIPLNSNDAYSTVVYDYTASSVTSIPNADIVDWVLVELRTGTTAGTKVATRAAFLKSDGTIVDITGSSPVLFNGLSEASYYIVVRHRNHLAVMSKDPVALSGSSSLYDFTAAQDQAYGTNPMKALLGNETVYGMLGGNGNGDGFVSAGDKNISWFPQNGTIGYLSGDFNLNTFVTSGDKNLIWFPNNGLVSQVP